jgi:uncharacterized damage-inducible protein DinB
MKTMLLKLYDYNYWSNDKILDLAEQLGPEEFVADGGYSRSSLHMTLFHMLRTEWVWRTLAQERRITAAPPQPEHFGTVAALREGWQAESGRLRGYVEGLSNDDLASNVEIYDREGNAQTLTIWHMLLHTALHSAQHRSEAAALLTGYGRTPGDLDFIFFVGQE